MIRSLTRPLAQSITRDVTEIRGPFTPPIAPPGAPTGVTATAGNAQATVTWTAPASAGGAPITGYRITSSPGGITATVGNVTSGTITGLTNGTAYTFTVAATNGSYGPESAASNSVTPANNLVQNSTFATDTNWTKGAGVTISGGQANKVSQAGSAGASLTQTLATPLSANVPYRLRYEVPNEAASGTTSGSLTPYLTMNGSVQNGVTRTPAGNTAYSEVITIPPGGTTPTTVRFDSAADASVYGLDNVSVLADGIGVEMVPDPTCARSNVQFVAVSTSGGGSVGAITCTNLNNSTQYVEYAPGGLVNGGVYEVQVTVAGYTGPGGLAFKIGGGALSTAITANGSYTRTITCGVGANFVIQSDSASLVSASITAISIKRVS